MVETAQKYNTSVMRAPADLRLNMPAFHHPFARNRNFRTTTKTMKCLQENHKVKTVADLVRIAAAEEPIACDDNITYQRAINAREKREN